MQEFINGLILFKDGFQKRNFVIDNDHLFFDYQKEKCSEVIDLKNKVVTPGFIDLHTHTRTPGFEYKEELDSINQAALKGGYTTILAMANLKPLPVDERSFQIVQQALNKSIVEIIQTGRITNSDQIVNFDALKQYTHFFSDDGDFIENEHLMKMAIKKAGIYNLKLIIHAQSQNVSNQIYTHKQNISNTNTITHHYESDTIKRDLDLLRKSVYKPHIHFQHLSTIESIDLIKTALKIQLPISAEVTPHHLFFKNSQTEDHGHFRMNPPLATPLAHQALIKAFQENLIQIIATDHAPHSQSEKDLPYSQALNGVIGLESAFAASWTILRKHDVSLLQVLNSLTYHPARFLGKEIDFYNGMLVNFNIIDPDYVWIFQKKDIASKSHNSPFIGCKFQGKVVKTFYKKLSKKQK